MAKKPSMPATQRYLDIASVREDVVVMRDGTLRAILAVSSINFALKSEDEQQAVIAQYIQFLNTLEFPLQIVIHSRKLDIAPYLEKLAARERDQQNELLKVQIAEYRKFVGELVELGEIMTKAFYVAIIYSPLTDRRKGFYDRLTDTLSAAKILRLQERQFQERRNVLLQRVGNIQGALGSLGLSTVLLDTQALIELFYALYNPATAANEKLPAIGDLQVEH